MLIFNIIQISCNVTSVLKKFIQVQLKHMLYKAKAICKLLCFADPFAESGLIKYNILRYNILSKISLKTFVPNLISLTRSSIGNWGYRENFKPVYFVFTKRFRKHKKAPNPKQATLTFLEVCARKKLSPLLFFVRLFLFY